MKLKKAKIREDLIKEGLRPPVTYEDGSEGYLTIHDELTVLAMSDGEPLSELSDANCLVRDQRGRLCYVLSIDLDFVN